MSTCALFACRDGVTEATPMLSFPQRDVTPAPTANTYLSQLFHRDRGAPVTVRTAVDVPVTTREVTFRLTNGAANGTQRVSSATITLNGRSVLLPSDFSQATAGTTMVLPIGSERPLTLDVQLQGAPEAYVHIELVAGVPLTPEGGALSLAGGAVSVVAPAGAVEGATQITAEPVPATPASGELTIYDFGPDGSEFAQPLTITLPYDPASLPPGAEPALYWRRDVTSPWQVLQNPRFDAEAGTATGELDHFTQVGVLVSRIRVCPGSPRATPTIEEAYPLIARGGRIQLCDGVHVAPSIELSKGFVLEGTGASVPTIETTRPRALIIAPPTGDTITVRNVALRGHTLQGVFAVSRGGQVEIDGVRIEDQAPGTIGVYATFTPDAVGAYLVVRNSTVSGGANGLYAPAGSGIGRVDFFDNTVSFVTSSGIQYQARASNGTASGNTVRECGSLGCMRASSSGAVSFLNNTIVNTARPSVPVPHGISVLATSASVIGNTIEGLGDIGDRRSPADYPFRDAAILIAGQDVAATAVVSSNVMSGGARGIQTATNVGVPLTVTGSDNVIRRSRDAVAIRIGSRLTLRRSDITDYTSAVFYDFPSGSTAPLQAGDLACNWWGTSTGPVGAFGGLTFPRLDVPGTVYLPVAAEPIANRPDVACSF